MEFQGFNTLVNKILSQNSSWSSILFVTNEICISINQSSIAPSIKHFQQSITDMLVVATGLVDLV